MRVKGTTAAALRRQPGARRPPPARRRLPAAGLLHPPGAALSRPLPPARRPGPARRVPEHRPDGRRRGRARRSREGAAADPRDAVRLDRLVHRRGVGERRAAGQRLGDVRRPRPGARRSTPATGRFARPRGAALAGLSEGGYGALNIGLHHPGEFRVLESWSGYAQAADIGSIFGHRRARSGREHAARHARARRRGAEARARLRLVLQRHRRQVPVPERGVRPRSDARPGPHRFFLVRGGHNWALWRGNAADAYLAASRRLGHA